MNIGHPLMLGTVAASGGGSAPAFTPADDGDLISWWATDDASTITHTSNAVSSFSPKAGSSSLALTQATALDQPTTNTRTINSVNVLDCTPTDKMQTANTFPTPADGDFTVMMVCAIDAVDDVFDALFVFVSGGPPKISLEANNSAQFDGRIDFRGGTDSASFSGGPFSGNHIFHIVFDKTAGSYISYVDNVAQHTAVNYGTAFPTASTYMVFRGAGGQGNRTPNGAFGDIVITAAVDSTTVGDHYNYLATKYGI